jgi:PAS domain S-box-containing protein
MIVDSHTRKIFGCFPLYIIFDQDGIVVDFGGYNTKGIALQPGDNVFTKFVIRNNTTKARLFINSSNLNSDVTIVYNEDNIIILNGTIDYILKHNAYIFVSHNKPNANDSVLESERFVNLLELLLAQENRAQDAQLKKALDYYRSYGIDNGLFSQIVLDKSDSVTLSDLNGNVMWCNTSFVQLTGLSSGQIIGKRPRDSMYGKGSVYIDKGFVDRNVENRKPFYFENIGYDSRGKEYWFSAKVYPVISTNKEIIGRIHVMRDITSVKVTQINTEINENLLKIAIDVSNAGVWSINLRLNKIDLSDEFKRILLLRKDIQYTIRDVLKMINSSDRLSIYNRINKTVNSEYPHLDMEIRISINGAIHYFQLRGKCIQFDTENKPILLIGTVVDVTEYKEIIRKVDYQKQFYNSILNQIPSDIVVWNTAHKYKYINHTAIKNDGIRTWLIDKDDFDYCELKGHDPSLAIERRERFEGVLSSKLPQKYVEKFSAENTTYKLRIMYPVLNGNNVEYVIGYGTDITEQIENQNKALTQANELRHTLDIVKDGIATIAFDGSFLEANKAFYDIISISADDSIGRNISEFLPDGLLVSLNKKIKHLLSNYREHHAVINTNIGGVDKIIDYSLTVSFSTLYGSCLKLRITDVTSIINRENDLKAIISKEIELNSHKTQFIRITSHELRTPLAIIKSSTELIQHHTDNEEMQSKYGKYINNILYQVDAMAEILNQLVLINKMGSGSIKLNCEDLLVSNFISDVIKSYTPFMDGRYLQIQEIDDVEIFIDAALLKIAINNLLTNSFKYSIGKEAPILSVINQEDKLLFSIKDFGIGIPSKDIKHLFSSFYRGSNVSTISGSGIGLTIVDFVVKMHKGSVNVISDLGAGSEFIVSLPLKKKKR